jgi:hypothetical protein
MGVEGRVGCLEDELESTELKGELIVLGVLQLGSILAGGARCSLAAY